MPRDEQTAESRSANPARRLKRLRPEPGLIPAAIILATLVVIGLVGVGTASAIRREQLRAEAETRAAAASLAGRLASDADVDLQSVAAIVGVVRGELGTRPEPAPNPPNPLKAGVAAVQATAQGALLLRLVLVDANGNAIAGTSPDPEALALAKAALARASLTAFPSPPAGEPLIGGAGTGPDGRPEIVLLRSLPESRDRFLVAVLDLASLVGPLLADAELRPRDVAALTAPNGAPLAVLGIAGLEPAAALGAASRAAIAAHATPAVWVAPAPDGRERIYAERALPGLPVVLVVGIDRQEALAAADTGRTWLVAIAGILTLLFAILAAVSLIFLAMVRRRSAALAREQAELRDANARLAAAKVEAEAKTAQLEGMLANMSDGVSLFDGEFRIRQWNAHFFERTGVPRERLRAGMTIEEILRIQAEVGEFGPVDVEREVARRMTRVRDLTHLGVIERLRPNGMTIELRRSLMPDGGFVTLYADITARREAEAARRLANEAAEAAVAAKAEFVATVTHEIRSPLNAVINSLDLLAASGLPPAQRKLAEAARGAGDALRTLITDLLDIARIDAGQFHLAPEDFALRPLLHAIAEMFHSAAQARGLAITLRIAPDLPERLHADPRRLRQVLLNFLSNAVKFSTPGTITPGTITPGTIILGAELASGRILLSVGDPGPAISAADRARLFQPFQRLESARTSAQPGSGLGLAISQRLAVLMGGAIGCEPARGGNRFWLAIPLTPALAARDPSPPAALIASHQRLPRARVLLVEDVPANQLILATTLRRDGHLVDIAASGEAALAALARAPYDIAFLDLHLPGINGLETARRIRALPGPAASMRLVGLTASTSADSRARCLEAGMNDVLGKPVTNAELTRTLAGQLQPRGGQARAQATAPTPPASIDAERIATLRRELPPGLLNPLAEQCLADLAGRLPKLRAALEQGQATEVATITHTIGGTAVTYGLIRLAALARDLATASRNGNNEPTLMSAIEAEYTRSAQALRALLSQ